MVFVWLSRLFGRGKEAATAPRTPFTPFSLQPKKSVATEPMVKWREGSFPMAVVGESAFQDALISICGRHTRHGHEGVYEAALRPEPTNPHDPNAIMVHVKGRLIGYLSREQAIRVGQQMRDAGLSEARSPARIRGGWRTNQYDEGHYGVQLAIPNQGWIDFGIGATPPKPVKVERAPKIAKVSPSPAASGPLSGKRVALIGSSKDGTIAVELSAAGAQIMGSVGKTTDILVVVAEKPFDVGVRRSAAYQKAQALIEEGAKVEIMSLGEIKELILARTGRDHSTGHPVVSSMKTDGGSHGGT